MDIQSSVTQRAGVGRYTCALASELDKLVNGDILELFYFDFQGKAICPVTSATTKAIRWCPGRAAQFLWKTFNWPPFDVFAGKADVYHFPNFILPPLRKGKTVATIHDVAFKRYPQYVEERNRRYLESKIQDTAARADAIITVSKFSASEITECLGIKPDRIFPVHNGISGKFHPVSAEQAAPVLEELSITGPYLLFVGTVEPRKNISLLIDVFEAISDFQGKLVIAGSLGWKYESIVEAMRSSSRKEDIIHLQHVGDGQLPALYSQASALVFPSFYEGFGFPPLESMACGTPVVSSSAGSLPEIVADAALLVESFETEEWREAVRSVLYDTGISGELRRKGLEQAARFSWKNAASQILQIYREVAS